MSRSRSTVRRPSAFAAQAVPGVVHDVLRSAGEPLSASVRAHMESRFGRDFSQVRVHADERAAEASEAVNASAFTAGRSIVFGDGEYQPETGPGRMLLAHELAHVVQQGARTEAPTRVGASSDQAEREARGVAQGVALGGPVAVKPSFSPPIVQRQELPPLYKPHTYFQELLEDAERMRRALGPIDLSPPTGLGREKSDFFRSLPAPIRPWWQAAPRPERAAGTATETREDIENEAKREAQRTEGSTSVARRGLQGSPPPGSTPQSVVQKGSQEGIGKVIEESLKRPGKPWLTGFKPKVDFGGGFTLGYDFSAPFQDSPAEKKKREEDQQKLKQWREERERKAGQQ